MSEPIKFSEEEVKSIVELQDEYQQKIFELGQIRLELIDIDRQKKSLEEKEKEIVNEWEKCLKKENDLVNALSEKYGDGKLNLKDGTFTPIK